MIRADEIPVRQWQEKFRAGAFLAQDKYTQCRAGWYDCFCQDHALAGRLKKIGKVVMGITDPFILDNYYVWFKNNCPLSGPLYDDARFEPLSGERGGKYFVISLDSPHERMKWALVTERYGFDAPEFDCRDIREMIRYVNRIGPELRQGVIPPFVAEKDAVTAYARQRGEPEGLHIYRDGDHCYSYTSRRDRRKRTVMAVAGLEDVPAGFVSEQAHAVKGMYVYSYTAQKAYYTQKIGENPDWEMAGIFADKGITGTSMKKRTEFKRMIAACKRGRIDLILTKSLSRFARNTVDSLEMVRMLRANGIGVIFEKENINTLTESSEFLITLFSGFAQAESESISKNVIWGIQKSREAGNVPFQYQKLLGYRRGPDGQPEIIPEEAETVKRIFRRYLDGCSLGQIKAELEADHVPTACGIQGWTYQVIHNILVNEKYIGDALLQKTYTTDCISKTVKKNQGERPMVYVENNHPPIIPKEIFYQVREEMARRASKRKVMQKTAKTEQGKYSAKYALSELLVCGECGTPYKRCTWARNGKKRIVWRCISRLEFGTKFCHNSPTLDEDKLHRAILEAINGLDQTGQEITEEFLDIASLVQQGQESGGVDPLTLRQRLTALTAEQAVLMEQALALPENMENKELNARLREIAEERESILHQLGTLRQADERQAGQAARMERLREFVEQRETKFAVYDDAITRKFVEQITVLDAETIRIKFRYPGLEVDKSLN